MGVQDGVAHGVPSVWSAHRQRKETLQGAAHQIAGEGRAGWGVGLIPNQDVGDAEVRQGLPGLDEAQLGLRQRELGHVLVGFQNPWGELWDHTGEGPPKSLRTLPVPTRETGC